MILWKGKKEKKEKKKKGKKKEGKKKTKKKEKKEKKCGIWVPKFLTLGIHQHYFVLKVASTLK